MAGGDDAERRALFEVLERALGAEGARRLMAQLPPFPWEEIATKADLRALEARFDGRFRALEDRFDGLLARFDGLDARFDGLDARFDGLDDRFLTRELFEERMLRHEHQIVAAFRGELNSAVVAQSRMLIFSVLGAVVSGGSLVLAAARFGG